jgi:ABC-type lipoprotein release transport system permease subunit
MKWIERQRAFLDYTLSSLWRRKGKNAALILVYTLVVFVISSVTFFAGALKKEAELVLADAPEMIVQRMVGGRHDLIPMGYAAKVKDMRGVQSVKPRLWGYYFHPAARSNYTIMVPENFSHGENTVEVGQGVLRTWGTVEKDKLYFKTHDGATLVLEVVKVFEASTDLVTADLILMSEPAFRKISGVAGGFASDLAVNIRNERERRTIAQKISQAMPDTRPILREEILRTYASLFDWRGGYMIVLLSGAVFAFFIFAWDKATGLSAEERTEIGILKGVGWDTSDILMIKFWEGIGVSLTSFLLGVLAGYIHVFFASATLFEHALKGWAVLYPTFTLKPEVGAFQLAVLFFLTVGPYTLVTVLPIWKVSTMDPDTVMRRS